MLVGSYPSKPMNHSVTEIILLYKRVNSIEPHSPLLTLYYVQKMKMESESQEDFGHMLDIDDV